MPRFTATGILSALLACGCASSTWDPALGVRGPVVEANPFVHQDGARLVDGNGHPVRLRGVNLGGWLNREGWIWGGPWQGSTELLARIAELVGRHDAEAFRDAVYAGFVTQADIAAIAALGLNTVRVPLHRSVLERDGRPLASDDPGWALLDDLLSWCEAHGLWAVLDLHAAPGGQSPWYMADPERTSLWDSPDAQDRTVAWWRAVARRYRDHPAVGGYDLLNEPFPPNGAALVALYRRIAEAIREEDPRHLILVEGAGAADDFASFDGPIANNQAYSFHQYTFFGDWRRDELDRYAAISEAHGMPFWNGEFGLASSESIGESVALYDTAPHVVGFAYWTWKMAPGLGALARMRGDLPAWQKLMVWAGNRLAPMPTGDEARAGMAEFLDAMRFENCTIDPDFAEAFAPTQ